VRRGRTAFAVIAGFAVLLAACSDTGSSSSDTSPESSAAATATSAPDITTDPRWEEIDRGLTALGPETGFLAARVSSDGTCEPIHEVAATTPRPIGSQFKLYVLGALVDAVESGTVSWDQELTIEDATKSPGNGEGSLQTLEPGSTVTVEEAATKMISISDNTAADMLIGLVGRDAVEATAAEWMQDPAANVPFLTTRQMFLLHYVPGLADGYLATPPDQRAAFLAYDVDPRHITEISLGLSTDPRFVDTIERFASPDDICRAFAGLQDLSTTPSGAPLSTILSQETAGVGLEPDQWPTVWYKGGSEPGVLTLGWLATNSDGETFVVTAMVANPDAALAPDSITQLRDLGKDAFALLEGNG
jgi:beta-lactamase class A